MENRITVACSAMSVEPDLVLIKVGETQDGDDIYTIGRKKGPFIEYVELRGTETELRHLCCDIRDAFERTY